jgi:hypothetical protein
MAAPASFEDTIRRHLAAFYSWLGQLRVDYGGPTDFPDGFPFKASYPTRQNFPILRTMATRERAFATVVDLLVHHGWIDTGTAAEIRTKAADFAVLPLPVVTYEKGDPEIDSTAGSVPKRFARSFFNQATLKWESHQWPGTYWLPIRATFWCSKRYTEAFMQEWVFSQLGKLGAADREVLIPVEHLSPWNTQWQALQLEGVADQSELEGDPLARQIRYEISFRLRMLHFRPDVIQDEPVNVSAVPITLAHEGDTSEVNPFDRTPDVPHFPGASDNLYLQYYSGDQIAANWPRTGSATVREGDAAPEDVPVSSVIRGTVRTVQDRIGITNRPVRIDATPHDIAILSVALRYKSTAEVGLKLFQRPGNEAPVTWTLARGVVLPASSSWVDLQFLTLVDDPIFTLLWEGRAIAADLSFADVSVRHLFSGARQLATGTGPGLFGTTKHSWNGLDRATSYLVVVLTASTGQHEVRLDDDDVTPTHTLTRVFDADNEVGYAEVVQPRAGSIAVSLPSGLVPTAVFIQPYAGALRPRLT